MHSLVALVAVLSFRLAPFAVAQTCTPCEDVHFFLARGNNEPYPGRQAALVSATCDGVASCGYEDLIYSALYTDLYCQTAYDGTIAGLSQVTAYAERCPDSKLILAGYSQGAQIMTDILGGGGGVAFNGCEQPSTPALNQTVGKRIAAALVFGNVRHTADQPYNFGNGSSYDGALPRSGASLTTLDSYKGVLRDWCLQDDPICAVNQTDSLISAHLGYFDLYSEAAASWIKSVASLTSNSDFHTSIPLSISGTAQDHSTWSYTPSGTVTTAATTFPVISCAATTTAASTSANSTLSRTLSSGESHITTSFASSTASISTPLTSSTVPTSINAALASASSSSQSSSFSGSARSHSSNLGLVLLLALLPIMM